MSKQFDRMATEIEGVSALASELLTLARLGVATASVPFAVVNLSELIADIVADARYEAQHRAADLIFVPSDVPLFCLGNAGLLRRAIENVVRNALFYTPDTVPIEIRHDAVGDATMHVTVKDGGPGVPEAALEYLFDPFYRVDPARNAQTGGAGLGLSICQRVVTLHGGGVSATNIEPHGLQVTISLPRTSPPPDSELA
jgi:signal transduction histidine kinase